MTTISDGELNDEEENVFAYLGELSLKCYEVKILGRDKESALSKDSSDTASFSTEMEKEVVAKETKKLNMVSLRLPKAAGWNL